MIVDNNCPIVCPGSSTFNLELVSLNTMWRHTSRLVNNASEWPLYSVGQSTPIFTFHLHMQTTNATRRPQVQLPKRHLWPIQIRQWTFIQWNDCIQWNHWFWKASCCQDQSKVCQETFLKRFFFCPGDIVEVTFECFAPLPLKCGTKYINGSSNAYKLCKFRCRAVKGTEFKLWCFWSAECLFESSAVTLVSLKAVDTIGNYSK